MHHWRFPEDDLDGLTRRQIMGKEGENMKSLYLQYAQEYDVIWKKRIAQRPPDVTNKFITIGNTVLYSLARTTILNLGLSTSLGVIHSGHPQSFVFDLADLYKVGTSIKAAFEIASIGQDVKMYRERLRHHLYEQDVMKRLPEDIGNILQNDSDPQIKNLQAPQVVVKDGLAYIKGEENP